MIRPSEESYGPSSVGKRVRQSLPDGCRRLVAQSTVEYALVGALVVIAAATALTLLSTEVTTVFSNITNTLKTASAGH